MSEAAVGAAAAAAVGGELTEEQLRELRGLIHQNLLRHDVYGQIRNILSQNCVDPTSGSFKAPSSPADVLEALRQRGIVQQIAASVASGGGGSNNFHAAAGFAAGNIFSAGGKSGAAASGGMMAAAAASSLPARGSGLLQLNRVSSVDVRAALGRTSSSSSRLLLIRLLGGRAFVDNMSATPGEVAASAAAMDQSMVVHIHFGNHRFRSQPRPLDVDPDFDDEFLAEISNPYINSSSASSSSSSSSSSTRDISELDFPLRIVVSREAPFMAKGSFVGENTVDWRRVLKTGSLSVAVELSGHGAMGLGVPAGLLELQLELVPDLPRTYSDDELQMRSEQTRNATVAADREMLLYARRWWAEYHALSPRFAQRKVKVFAHAAGGRNLPVTHFVHRIAPDRSLDGPEDVARFVSLFALDKPDSGRGSEFLIGGGGGADRGGSADGGGADSVWCDMFRFVATRRGDKPAHATLLCSLFLGMGLDAYVVIGTAASDDNSSNGQSQQNSTGIAVITRKLAKGQQQKTFTATLWDPVTGTHRDVMSGGAFCMSTVGCVFNATDYFANIQSDDSLLQCDFDLDDESKWMRMNPVKLHVVPRMPAVPPLWMPLDTRSLELDFEQRLQRAIADHRSRIIVSLPSQQHQQAASTTIFDTQLSSCFAQALAKSELRRRGIGGVDMDLFEQCVRGFVEGHTFKGLPLCMPHLDAGRVLLAALQVPVGKTVVECPFEGAVLAVRSKVFLFPDGVVACWVMIGVKHRTLDSASMM